MKIPRALHAALKNKLITGDKIIVLYGPRQVGKTTLIHDILEELPYKTLSINGEEEKYVDVLTSRDVRRLQALTGDYQVLFIDEAQHIPDIGLTLKLMIDHLKPLKIIASGSSSFELANTLTEPLTGRKWTYVLYPIAYMELASRMTPFELDQEISSRLIWGSYPDIFPLKTSQDKIAYLTEITTDYLFKDVLKISNIRHARKLQKLVRLLAFQIGSQVSLTELGAQLGMSKETVAHYLDLLEKTYVIHRLGGFSRNLRKEVSKTDKYYFYDLGIRNKMVDNFSPLESRGDTGALWENFLLNERLKKLAYTSSFPGRYFWRTYTGAEIDYVEEQEGILSGFEFKWGKTEAKSPRSWMETYLNAQFTPVNADTYKSFIMEKK